MKNERDMMLLKSFTFVDSKVVEWRVPAGCVFGGASIPRWIPGLWNVLGSPYTGRYRRAAVIHDYYCESKTRKAADTERVFREAMICDGVNAAKAWGMAKATRPSNNWPDPA